MKSAGMSHLEVGVTIAVDHFPRATMKHTFTPVLLNLQPMHGKKVNAAQHIRNKKTNR